LNNELYMFYERMLRTALHSGQLSHSVYFLEMTLLGPIAGYRFSKAYEALVNGQI
jgi:hypothetical protein